MATKSGRVIELDGPDSGYGAEHRGASPLHDWRVKVAVQTLLSGVPFGNRLNFLLQRHVTKTLPVSDAELINQVSKAKRHLAAFNAHARMQRPLSTLHVFEFGVGWDLVLPITYYAMGIERQTVVDIQPLARYDLVADAARRIAAASERIGLARSPVIDRSAHSVMELAAMWGIDYRAPADARSVSLPDDCIDLVTSTDVLEHVPPSDIARILTECDRLLRPGGLMTVRIDYQDHYWYFDPNVDPYHFLRFSSSGWKRYNPTLHYQNRLRHSQIIEIIHKSGFDIVHDDHHVPTEHDLETIARTRLADEFGEMSPDDLAIRFANLTLAPRGNAAPTSNDG